ncbi:ABC transporter ATP-binding protein [Falsochrobactrum sp. TDYN1]|uniref:Nickel import system ATP-binding protein NikD n=1 Tax=Falsochrobactrum tianjinense TaxID=2706015 RepID=A0A949PP94_9HYPH|nr:ABC transporter ATP-binding protein [Falsochrobactrum sp. TDYN1]MBV2143709.1 ABC transporter ATP-binding protein [Falsochrobactrum sp. TDYN1]
MKRLAQIRGLSVRYSAAFALDHVDLDLMTGETLAIIGESGSGKTTLAQAMGRLLPANARISGHIDWPGFDRLPKPGCDIGFVFQDPASSFDPLMSIGAQLVETIRTHEKIDRDLARKRATALLERVHIPQPQQSFARYPHQFSGGQKQRIAIALAIAAAPRLLIADEPTSALDTIVQKQIAALLQKLVREDGMTLLFITHDIALASGLADRIAVFRQGRLVETGRTETVLARPESDYTRALIAAVPRLETAHG